MGRVPQHEIAQTAGRPGRYYFAAETLSYQFGQQTTVVNMGMGE